MGTTMRREKKILVTGSNGFVGRAQYDELRARGFDLRGSVRNIFKSVDGQSNVVVGQLDDNTEWGLAVAGCTTVIHLAGRAHILNDSLVDQVSAFVEENTSGTINLAKQAVQGVSTGLSL